MMLVAGCWLLVASYWLLVAGWQGCGFNLMQSLVIKLLAKVPLI